ncbi:hypothetical protein H1C71_004104 [Ictidomys tridecemlineatus]|nr:hypothetical protein H1C71_004104 [Ictidomys tridecemlineatus]
MPSSEYFSFCFLYISRSLLVAFCSISLYLPSHIITLSVIQFPLNRAKVNVQTGLGLPRDGPQAYLHSLYLPGCGVGRRLALILSAWILCKMVSLVSHSESPFPSEWV